MPITEILIIVVGLMLFEAILSLDNAIINADVLSTMPRKWHRWFLVYGSFVSVFVMRGLLPLLIIYLAVPGLGLLETFTAVSGSDPGVRESIESQTPILFAGGGTFLILLFLHWLFLEPKRYAIFLESHIHKKYHFWFYSLAAVILLTTVWLTIKIDPLIALGAVVGSTAFFIVNGFKRNAEEKEKELAMGGGGRMTNLSKLLYLELIDATFSIDGVLGAFAFTTLIPLILVGNGLAAVLVRAFTVYGINTVRRYAYLKNGAMYSVGVLGASMVLESLGYHIPSWLPTFTTFAAIAFFLYLSHRELRVQDKTAL